VLVSRTLLWPNINCVSMEGFRIKFGFSFQGTHQGLAIIIKMLKSADKEKRS